MAKTYVELDKADNRYCFLDVGGQQSFKQLWPQGFKSSSSTIFVTHADDLTDDDDVEESVSMLKESLEYDDFDRPLLVVVNRKSSSESAGCKKMINDLKEVTKDLKCAQIMCYNMLHEHTDVTAQFKSFAKQAERYLKLSKKKKVWFKLFF